MEDLDDYESLQSFMKKRYELEDNLDEDFIHYIEANDIYSNIGIGDWSDLD